MNSLLRSRTRTMIATLLVGGALALAASAQQPPQGGPPGGGGGPPGAGGPPGGGGPGGPPGGMPSPAEQAIGYRQALFTLIGGNFGTIGGVMQGRAEFKADEVMKRAQNTAYLATMVADAFPEVSKTGNTKAKPEVWSNPAGFAKASKDFVDSSAALVAALKKDNSNSAAFKAAAGAVGESCKNCHQDFRAK